VFTIPSFYLKPPWRNVVGPDSDPLHLPDTPKDILWMVKASNPWRFEEAARGG